MTLRYFGHSAFEIVAKGSSILLDPFVTDNPHAKGLIAAKDLSPQYILVTHAHGDHWGDTLPIAKRTGATIVANFEITQYARRHGHDNVLAMNTGGSAELPFGTVRQTDAKHSSSFADGTYGGNPNGFLIHSEDRCVYALGDTSPFAEMEWIGQEYDVDVALVPIGDRFTMGPADSVKAMRLIRPSITIPVHYNTFPEIEIDVGEWKEMVGDLGFVGRILAPGEALDV